MLNIKTKDKKPIGLTAFASPLAKPSERIVLLVVALVARQTYHVLRQNANAGHHAGNHVRIW